MNDVIRRAFVVFTGRKAELQERGATAVEYGMLVALIAAVIILTVVTLGGQINDAFQKIVNSLGDNVSA